MKRCKRLLLVMITLASSLTLSACNTVEGAGKDLQDAGEAIEDAADDE